jgi:eukaryotic-like serine/threonine-protein kinase
VSTPPSSTSEHPDPDPGAIKARLFGRERGEPVHKQLIKARLLSALAAGVSEPGAAEPVRIGRYLVLRKLGQGGMGVVYLAYDEELDRKVALKLLREQPEDDSQGRARTLREAQALARLSHPNVVGVYEVGRWDARDFVAMEYVDGQTFDRWLAAQPRRWSEIVAMLAQAGRGLEAAHQAGLVHRDFKPSNLLIGGDGRARVCDFGLARRVAQLGPDPADAGTTQPHSSIARALGPDSGSGSDSTEPRRALDSNVGGERPPWTSVGTRSGAVIGTPAYMAPEQHLGRSDPLSDQFSFCVVAFEALYGERPFAGAATSAEVLARIRDGHLAAGSKLAGAPAWLRKLIVRGLAYAPEQRWPSMAALLAELGRDRGRAWGGLALIACVGLSVAIAVVVDREQGAACRPDPASVADSWGPSQREAVTAAFAASGLDFGPPFGVSVRVELDRYAEQIVAGRAAACSARWLSGTQTDAQLAVREACLDQRERELRAVVDVLVDADVDTVIHAHELLAGLGEVELCSQVELLAAGIPAPRDAEAIARIAEVREQIARAHAARNAGRIAEADAITAEAWAGGEALGYEPLLGELHLLAARNDRVARRDPAARQHLIEAAAIAQRSGHPTLAAEVWVSLAQLAALDGVDPDTSLEFILADTAVAEIGSPRRRQLALALARGVTLVAAGRMSEAVSILDHAIAQAEVDPGAHTGLTLANLLLTRSRAHAALARTGEARADLERAAATVGVATRDQLDASFDLGVLELESGDLDAAEADFRAAMRGYEQLFGPDFESIGHGHLALAGLALKRDQPELAKAEFDRAAAVFGDDHPDRDWVLDGLAAVQLQTGETAAGIASLRAAIEHRTRLAPSDHGRLAYLRVRLGIGLLSADRDADALAEFDAAIAEYERPEVELPLELARGLQGRGEVLARLGRHAEAIAALERAIELTPPDCGEVVVAGESRIILAKLLDDLGIRVRERRELARVGAELLSGTASSSELRAIANRIAG